MVVTFYVDSGPWDDSIAGVFVIPRARLYRGLYSTLAWHARADGTKGRPGLAFRPICVCVHVQCAKEEGRKSVRGEPPPVGSRWACRRIERATQLGASLFLSR